MSDTLSARDPRDPLATHFDRWRREGHTALIPFITAGYPAPAATDDVLDALVAGGADIIELGIPFSDPTADGPTIQRASQSALDQGVTLAWTLDALRRFRTRHDTPVVLFSYLNPILRYGIDEFIRDAEDAGAQGILLTDLPVGGDNVIEAKLEQSRLSLIRLVAPTTTPERFKVIAARAQGFIYYIARLGVTGAGGTMRDELEQELAAMKSLTPIPIAVGFGVSTPAHAARLRGHADAIIIGSALIDKLDQEGIPSLTPFLRSLHP